jgi:hypothetical protein
VFEPVPQLADFGARLSEELVDRRRRALLRVTRFAPVEASLAEPEPEACPVSSSPMITSLIKFSFLRKIVSLLYPKGGSTTKPPLRCSVCQTDDVIVIWKVGVAFLGE